jgi:hypothetical protein
VNTAFFDVFGVKPVADGPSAKTTSRSGVISYGYAIDHYGSAAAALGKVVSIDTRPYEVVGVMPPAVPLPAACGGLGHRAATAHEPESHGHNYPVVARIRPGLPWKPRKRRWQA